MVGCVLSQLKPLALKKASASAVFKAKNAEVLGFYPIRKFATVQCIILLLYCYKQDVIHCIIYSHSILISPDRCVLNSHQGD